MEQEAGRVAPHSLIFNKLSTPAAPLASQPTLARGRYVDLNYMRSVAMKAKKSLGRTYSDPTTDIDKHLIKRAIFTDNKQKQQQQPQQQEEIKSKESADDGYQKETRQEDTSRTHADYASSLSDLSGSEETLAKPKLRRSSGRRADTFQNLLKCSTDDIVDSFTGEKVGLSVDSVCGDDLAKKDEARASLAALNKLPIWESMSLTFSITPTDSVSSNEKLIGHGGRHASSKQQPRARRTPKSILVRKRLRRSSSFPSIVEHNTSKGVKFALTSCNFVSCPSHVFPTEPYAVAFDMPFDDSEDELIVDYPTPPTRSQESLPTATTHTKDVISVQPQRQRQKLLHELEADVTSPPTGARYIIVDTDPDDCLHCLRLSKEAVKCCTCLWCVQAGCYHCRTQDDTGDMDWLDNLGSCKGTRRQNCRRWGALGAMSLVLPCLLFYPPLVGALNACMRFVGRNDEDNDQTHNKRT